MEKNDWDRFYHTGKVEDYLSYRAMENKAVGALDSSGLVKPALAQDVGDTESQFVKPALPMDVEQENADKNGRYSS